MIKTATRLPLDVFVHSNPALSALAIHWTVSGYEKERKNADGLLFTWSIFALAAVASSHYRDRLPKTTNARLTLYYAENPELRVAVPSMLAVWRDAFWTGLRYGVSANMLSLRTLRVSSVKTRMPARTGFAEGLEAVANRLGRMLAREGSDDRIASALGVGFEV